MVPTLAHRQSPPTPERRAIDGRTGRAVLAALVLGSAVVLAGMAGAVRSASDPASTEPPGPDARLVDEALRIIHERYVDPDVLTTENLTRGAIRGIVDALGDDGHTIFLTPEEVEAERDALDGRVKGIGVIIDRRSGIPLILSVISGSPAATAGLQAGDLIVSVDGQDVGRLPLGDVAQLVTGDAGTSVRLGIERPGSAERIEVTIVRAEVEVPPISWSFVPGSDVVVIRVVQFSSGASRELRAAVEEIVDAGAVGLVIDLRGNPGGLVDEAVSVLGAFVEDGVAFRQRDRSGEVSEVQVRGPAIAPDIPLVVLVDYGSASAAEIVAASLRDNGRASIVGEQTFGTGTVLNTFGLSDGSALRLGVLEWLTPRGERMFRVGVEPDETVERLPGAPALEPGDLVGMTAADLEASGDRQLMRAAAMIEPQG